MREGDDVTIVALGRMVAARQRGGRLSWRTRGSSARSSIRARPRRSTRTRSSRASRAPAGWSWSTRPNPRCGMAADIVGAGGQRARSSDLKAPIRMVTPPHTPVPFSPVARGRLRAEPRARDRRRGARVLASARQGAVTRAMRHHQAGHAEVGPLDDRRARRRTGSSRRAPRSNRARSVARSRPRRSPAPWSRPVAGILRRRIGQVGEVIPVGGLLGVIGDAAESRRRHRRLRRRVRGDLRAARTGEEGPRPRPRGRGGGHALPAARATAASRSCSSTASAAT